MTLKWLKYIIQKNITLLFRSECVTFTSVLETPNNYYKCEITVLLAMLTGPDFWPLSLNRKDLQNFGRNM
jgi:hypothetical protein